MQKLSVGHRALNPDGTLDATFAPVLAGPPESVLNWISSMVLQSDDKVLIGGIFITVDGVARNRIARLHPDGSTDRTFGEGLAGASGRVSAIAVQDDERIWIGGSFTGIHDEPRGRIARLHDHSAKPRPLPLFIPNP